MLFLCDDYVINETRFKISASFIKKDGGERIFMKRKLVTFIVLAVSTCSLLAGCGKATESGETVDSDKETAIETVTNTENDATTVSSTGEAPATDAPGEVAGEVPADGTDATATGSGDVTEVYNGIAFAVAEDGTVNPDEVMEAIAGKMNPATAPDDSVFDTSVLSEGFTIRNDFVDYNAAQSITDEEINSCVDSDGLYISKDGLKTLGDAQQLIPYLAYSKLTLYVIRQIADEYNLDISNAEFHIDFIGGFRVVDATTGEAIMEFTDYAGANGYRYYIASWNENGSRVQVGYAVPDIM